MAESSAVVLDDFGKVAKERLGTLIAARNEKASKIAAIQGDEEALVANVVETADDPNVVESRDRLEKLKAAVETETVKLQNLVKPLIEAFKADLGTKIEPLTAEVDEQDKQIRAAQHFLKLTYGEAALEGLPALVGRKGRTHAGGAGGTRRVRGFDVYVDGALATMRDAKGNDRSNLAAAAKVVGCETSVIQEAFFAAQGTKESESFKDRVEFTVTVNDENHIVVANRATAPSDAALASDAVAADEA